MAGVSLHSEYIYYHIHISCLYCLAYYCHIVSADCEFDLVALQFVLRVQLLLTSSWQGSARSTLQVFLWESWSCVSCWQGGYGKDSEVGLHFRNSCCLTMLVVIIIIFFNLEKNNNKMIKSGHYSGQSSRMKESWSNMLLNCCTRMDRRLRRWNKKAVSRSSPDCWVIFFYQTTSEVTFITFVKVTGSILSAFFTIIFGA